MARQERNILERAAPKPERAGGGASDQVLAVVRVWVNIL
jgi:hypothetical protein